MIQQLLEIIISDEPVEQHASVLASLTPQIKNLSESDIDLLLNKLTENIDRTTRVNQDANDAAPNITDQQQVILQTVVHELVLREQTLKNSKTDLPIAWPQSRRDQIEKLYLATSPESDLRNHLLYWLATEKSEASLHLWSNLVCNSPPEHRLGIVLAFAPLMQKDFDPPEWMLKELLEKATSHSQIAPPVFDLFNFYFRNQKVTSHTAASRIDGLTELLGQLVGQLGKIEGGNFGPDANALKLNQQVSDSVSLIVALCDAFALLNHEPAVDNLHKAMSLRHRRVQTEAAAALARMGVDEGKQTLIALAQQPIARMRALAYAEELGFKDKISLELQGEIAIAESHLAIWLSEPEQMGLAPSDIELVDNRELYWPSYEHPTQCFLFKYSYGTGEQAHTNIGICGPLTHGFAADLRELENDDIFAAFAGWQTVHQEIFQTDLERAQKVAPGEIARLERRLHEAFESSGEANPANVPIIQTVGNFFGQWVLISTASSNGKQITLIVDAEKATWIPAGNPNAPIDWTLAYSIWKGRELLASFNSEGSERGVS